MGVRHIVALRGDPPGGIGTAYTTHPDGYRSSAELVAGIKRQHGDIEVSVSAYPEKHPESPDFNADIDVLKAKVDAGAARAITQVFFDNEDRKSTRLNSSHTVISYAVFCLKKKKKK